MITFFYLILPKWFSGNQTHLYFAPWQGLGSIEPLTYYLLVRRLLNMCAMIFIAAHVFLRRFQAANPVACTVPRG
jgi:hypothetical protein